jgi:LemA protein
MKKLLIVVAILAILGLWAKSAYNGMVTGDENVKKVWAKVESQYQRRADLIPNLVNTVKGAANFEQETLTKVIEARAKATSITIDPSNVTPEQMAAFQAAQSQVSSSLGRLMAVAESYPQLKANQNFLDLQAQLEGTENRITSARNDFNDVVETFNVSVRQFPANLFAKIFGFSVRTPFAADKGAEKAPAVNFEK